MFSVVMWTVLLAVTGIQADDHVQPSVNLLSCSKSTVNLEIENGQSGGLMYIRNAWGKYSNIQPSSDGAGNYTCQFEACGLSYGESFVFIIQRRVTIQSGADLQIEYYCFADLNFISPQEATHQEDTTSEVVQFLYSAEVQMNFYTSGSRIVEGQYIKLGTIIDMTVNVTNNRDDFFDIEAKSCSVSTVQLIEDTCPGDRDLFDTFNKTGAGTLSNQFAMFRPTSTTDGPMDVMFTCTFEVCRDRCSVSNCTDSDVSGRRRRATDDSVLKTQTVGTMFSVGIDDYAPKTVRHGRSCWSKLVVIVSCSTISFLMMINVSTSVYFGREWRTVTMATKQRKTRTIRNTGIGNEQPVLSVIKATVFFTQTGINKERDQIKQTEAGVYYDNGLVRDGPSPVESSGESSARGRVQGPIGYSNVDDGTYTNGCVASSSVDIKHADVMHTTLHTSNTGCKLDYSMTGINVPTDMSIKIMQKLETNSTNNTHNPTSPEPHILNKNEVDEHTDLKLVDDHSMSLNAELRKYLHKKSMKKHDGLNRAPVASESDDISEIGRALDCSRTRTSYTMESGGLDIQGSAGHHRWKTGLHARSGVKNEKKLKVNKTNTAEDDTRLEKFQASLGHLLRRRSSIQKTPSMEQLLPIS